VLLAVFLSFWSFLYTYRTAAWKFWLSLGLAVGGYILVWALNSATNSLAGTFIWAAIALGVWIWAIVDRSMTPL
jgi:hypothetical protein